MGETGGGGQIQRVTNKQTRHKTYIHKGILFNEVHLQSKVKENEINLIAFTKSHSGFPQPSNEPFELPNVNQARQLQDVLYVVARVAGAE